MRRERVADDIYVFTSELYAQVTAGAVITPEGAIVIDTLVFPEESKAILHFIEQRLNTKVRYIINTHYHADHTYGTCFFESATVVSHALCYTLLDSRGRQGLAEAQQGSRTFQDVTVKLPNLVFEAGELEIRLGDKTLQMWHSPGHSDDSIAVLVKEDRVLFAADTMMPVPYFVDGKFDDFVESLKKLKNGSFENVVQGHGEVILRGEIDRKVESDLNYLAQVKHHVQIALTEPDPQAYLDRIDIEQCGKSRIPLNGEVQLLHAGNMRALLAQYQAVREAGK
ncbi:MAG: MBL fold metallo-hydrolase [Chloroflexi bacterium]|nr:MBL fold metallo-hydrolase [Chloroflexota bacterium]